MAEEIIPGRADYLVELRGFEAVSSAARAPALGRRLLGLILPRGGRLDPALDRWRSSLALRARHLEGLAGLDKHRWIGALPSAKTVGSAPSQLRRGQVMAFHAVEERHDGFEAFFIRHNGIGGSFSALTSACIATLCSMARTIAR
jgi:hypothetical protein